MIKKLLVVSTTVLILSGCATPAQNALLGGAIAGAVVGGLIHENTRHVHVYTPPSHPPTVIYPPRPLYCGVYRGQFLGRDRWGNPVYQYDRVCR